MEAATAQACIDSVISNKDRSATNWRGAAIAVDVSAFLELV